MPDVIELGSNGLPRCPFAIKSVAVVAVIAVALTSCTTIQDNPKTAVGGLGGATVGGLIAAAASASPAGIAAGVIGGALIGGFAGNLLDQRDKRMAAEAAQRALETAPSGKAVAWSNPDSGHSGTITPVRTFQSEGSYCREYQQTVTIDGKPEQSYGTACRQPDGSWKIAN